MIRSSRTRRNHPVWKSETARPLRRHAASDAPDLNAGPDDQIFSASVDEMCKSLPSHDERRRLLATDSLASVDGLRTIVQLTLLHLLGMNYCPNCPDCNSSADPCQDIFGSNATPEGGCFGRVDAVNTSIEAQTIDWQLARSLTSFCAMFTSAHDFMGDRQAAPCDTR